MSDQWDEISSSAYFDNMALSYYHNETLTVPYRLKTLGLMLSTRIQKINDIFHYILEGIYY
ncbi:MAG: hypothetical protein ACJ71D_07665 [Nitrososphaera sp.]